MGVPLLDLRAQFESIRESALSAVMEVIESQHFIMGEPVESLEAAVAHYVGTKHGVAVASGTDALLLSIKVLNLQPGDEVITTPFTFFATAGAIVNGGGVPVFVDIDPATFNIDVDALADAITEKTRAVVPVHLFGQMACMAPVLELAQEHNLAIVEDAAQAIGARQEIDGQVQSAGALGTTGAFSFFPSKNLGAWGDGGMIVTNDDELARRIRLLRTHGGAKQYHHDEIGTNSRLDTLQAAVLLAKLPHLDAWNQARRAHAARYSEAFADLDIEVPYVASGNESVFNQYTVRVPRRDGLRKTLTARGIGHAIYYPMPLHLQPCFTCLGYGRGSLPEAERASHEVVSLPVYPELTASQQDEVIETVRAFHA